jgi:hypothetical protein
MQALHHVESAIHHAICLADEAEDLLMMELAKSLRHLASLVSEQLEAALRGLDRVEEVKKGRALAHDLLSAAYGALTCQMGEVLDSQSLRKLTPGGHLDVVERTRYRLRRLSAMKSTDAVADLRLEHERALADYERAVDRYLEICTATNHDRQMAVAKSQMLRMELETAKKRLLAKAKVGGDAHRRIKRRTVRTKRPAWLNREFRDIWQAQVDEMKKAA